MLLRAVLVAGFLLLMTLQPSNPGNEVGGKNPHVRPVGIPVAALVAIVVIAIDALWDCLKPDNAARHDPSSRPRRKKKGP